MRISIAFSTSDWIVSRIIRFFTRSSVSHAFILIEGTELGTLAYEAEWNGLKLTTIQSVTRGSTRVVKTILPPVPQDVFFEAVRQSLAWIDERYNYTGLLGMAWVAVGRWLGKKIRNPFRSSRSLYCSESVVYVLQLAKCPGVSDLDPQSVSPQDLLDFLETATVIPQGAH